MSVEPTGLKKIGVAIVDSAALQAGILRNIVDDAEDLELVLESPLPLERVPREVVKSVDVLLVGADAIDARTMCGLLEAHPSLKTIAIGSNARDGRLYELAPSMVVLRPVTAATLVGAIRGAMSRCHADEFASWEAAMRTPSFEGRE